MDNKRFVMLVILVIAIVSLLLVTWWVLAGENGIIPWNGDGNGEPQISRTEWAFEYTQIVDMNDEDYYGEGVVLGIVDSGIDITHPDLDHINITAWKDYVRGMSDPYDDNGHGTHIAGIIAAQGEIDGVAPNVKMVVVKAISSSGSGTDSNVASGVDFCVENGADVICLSLGGGRLPFLGSETEHACEDAIDQGVYIVAAAGNDGDESSDEDVASPATVDNVIAVGTIDEYKNIAYFSSIGDNDGNFPGPFDDRQDPDKKPELVAPGVEIVSTWLDEDYATASGTSQSTAFVAGSIVLLLEAHPEYKDGNVGTITQFKNALMDSAEKCPEQDTPHDNYYGYGLIKVKSADNRL
jgi:serine protease AprX